MAGGEGGHDAGGDRAEACQGLGQGARSTLGKGAMIVISHLMIASLNLFYVGLNVNLLSNYITRWIGSYSGYVRNNRGRVGGGRASIFFQLQLKKLSLPLASISSSLATDILKGGVHDLKADSDPAITTKLLF